jgi:hypothetical protein
MQLSTKTAAIKRNKWTTPKNISEVEKHIIGSFHDNSACLLHTSSQGITSPILRVPTLGNRHQSASHKNDLDNVHY